MLSRRTRIALAVLVVASLTFVILDLRGGEGPMSSARSAISAVTGVLQKGASTVFSPVTSVGDWWSTWRNQATQIAELQRENTELRSLVRESENDRARADELDALLRVASVGRYRVVPAEVIAVGPAQDFAWTVTIDAGSLDGVERDMSVVNGDGLVGRIIKVNPTNATVLLLVDASSSVGGRVATTEEIGIVSGTGRQDSLDFQLLDPLAELVIGDALVTFGSRGGRPYVPGVPIGEVVDITGTAGQLTRIATVRPFADVSRLSVVGVVVRAPRDDPRDSVLPPRQEVQDPVRQPTDEPVDDAADGPTAPQESTDGTVDDGASTQEGQ
ncbi:MAG: rod shape-determining protein MreC [Candidatus Nanopelagicales bacterium]